MSYFRDLMMSSEDTSWMQDLADKYSIKIDYIRNACNNYNALSYIGSSGSQYILTTIYPTHSWVFDSQVATLSSGNVIYWGTRSEGSYNDYNKQLYLNSNSLNEDELAKYINLYSTIAVSDQGNWCSYIQPEIGNMYTLTGMTCVSTMINMSYSIALFAFNIKGTIAISGNVRIGYLHGKISNTSKCLLVSCRRKSDNTLGMLDITNNYFYTNNGSGTFDCGSAIAWKDKLSSL